MNNETKKGKLVPELRFPGFEGEWEVKKLGDILDYEQPTPYLVSSDSYQKDGTPVLTAGKTFILGYTDETFGIYNKVPVIIFDDFVTESKYVTFPFKAKSSAMKMLSLKDNSDNLYFAYISMLLNQKPIGDHKRHWISETSQIFVTVPPTKAEQQKIAECLSSVDNLIQAEADQLQALKDHKKGLMQQLFPQEGETTPKLRFPGFEGEWEEKKLGEVASSFSGGTPKSGNPLYYGGNIPFIRSGEIHGEGTDLHLTEEGLNNSSAKLVKKGDLLFALYGATSGEVDLSKIDGAINQAILCIRSKIINISFLCNYLQSKKEYVIGRFLQGGQGNLSGDIIMSLNITFPPLPEQQKIADCLSSLDEGIAAQQEKVEALKEHKKGLMQKLFPTIN